ncbi:uncharacterized protein METZ01_LOCUS512629, partial [marine metagenome]
MASENIYDDTRLLESLEAIKYSPDAVKA